MIDLIRRQIELLKLLSRQREYKPASFFSKLLKVSTKTIYSDITYLQSEAEKYSIDLIRVPRIGIQLEGTKENIRQMIREIREEEFNYEVKYSPEYRRLWIMQKVLVDCEKITLESVSQEFMVSKTSLYQDIAEINKLIQDGNEDMVKLEVGEQGFFMKEKEIRIQNALRNFLLAGQKEGTFTEFIGQLNQLFAQKIVEAISNLILDDYSELTDTLSEYYLESLLVTLIIQASRLECGFHIEKEGTISYNNIQYMETYVVANSMAEWLKKQLHLHYNTDDIEYLCRQLFAHRVTSHTKKTDPDYGETVRIVIQKMSEIQGIDLTQDSRLYDALLQHLPPMILRLKKNIHVVNPILETIKEEYPELFTTIWYALAEIESRYNVILTEDEVSFILLHFQLALDKFEDVGNIIVVCTYGVSSSQLILRRVKQILPAKDNIVVMNLKRLQETDLKNVDLIISPIDLEETEVPYVKVNPLLTKEDYTKILDAYTRQVLLPGNNSDNKEKYVIHVPILKQYLDPDFIFLKQDVRDKQECLDCMIDILEKKQLVYDGFRDSVYQREKMGSTCVDTGAALPHADPKTVKEAKIIFFTLQTPIDWSGINVSLIIMTAFPDKDMDQIRGVINELYQLISKKEYVDAFVQFETKEQILDVFHQ